MHRVGDYEFNVARAIGSGTFAQVFAGKHLTEGYEVAGKRLTGVLKEYVEQYEKEGKLAMRLSPHQNVVKVLKIEKDEHEAGTNLPNTDIWIITEFYPNTLSGYAYHHELSLEKKLELMAQCCSGLLHIHNHNVCHRDIKPGNIMVSLEQEDEAVVKIIDFGVSKEVVRKDGHTEKMNTATGSPGYMAPEILAREGTLSTANYNTSVDVFALGITFESLLRAKKDTAMNVFQGNVVLHMSMNNDYILNQI